MQAILAPQLSHVTMSMPVFVLQRFEQHDLCQSWQGWSNQVHHQGSSGDPTYHPFRAHRIGLAWSGLQNQVDALNVCRRRNRSPRSHGRAVTLPLEVVAALPEVCTA